MAENKPYDSILLRDGTSFLQRMETVLLQNEYFQPDERSFRDIYNFAKAFAEMVNFYEFESIEHSTNAGTLILDSFKSGDWSAFFEDITNVNLDERTDFDPHLALFLAFIKIFGHTKDHLNQFTQKHLDFYYKNVLGLRLQPGKEENVYLIFELAKNADEMLVEKGTLADAGKIDNQPATYGLTDDVVINKSSIASQKTISIDDNELDVIRFASQTNTSDGVSKKLPETMPYYDGFGLRHISQDQQQKAKIGFAIASPILLLKEGARDITITINLSNIHADLNKAAAPKTVELFFTGEKNWLGGYLGNVSFSSFKSNSQSVVIRYQLPATEPSLFSYSSDVHKGNFNTSQPLVQILIDTSKEKNLFRYLRTALVESISIDVDVKDVTGLELENDAGVLNPKKPFYPFGAIPKTGSAFTIQYEELMQKNVTGYQFNVEWLAPPSNFSDYYKEYNASGNSNSSFTAKYSTVDGSTGTTALFNAGDARKPISWPSPALKIVSTGFLLAKSAIIYNSLFNLNTNPNYKKVLYSPANVFTISSAFSSLPIAKPKDGFIRFELNRSFLHEFYGKKFANAVIKKTDLPNEPYSPQIKSISLNYKASFSNIKINKNSFDDFNKKQIQLFHVGVFGQSEQHAFLKNFVQQEVGSAAVIDKNIFLLPQYERAAFFIGIKDLVPGQSLSMLFQLAEGSSNPDADPVTVSWHVLCSNEWRPLSFRELLKNETNSLQQSGIVRVVIPESATTDNTLMDSGLVWLRASITANPDAVCLFESVIAQAARAAYQIPVNSNSSGAISAGTISKLQPKLQPVKKLSQPFSSFGGKSAEDAASFLLRISERLRHKQRPVMNWDFEHLVLQQFPQIYKAKCLNHFNDADDCCKEASPGFVTLVVVPVVSGKNFFNPLQPKVNTNIRQQIKEYLQPLVSFFTTLYIVNPDYETLLLDFKVRFTTAGDFGLYRDKLNTAIKNYLTPWAYDGITDVHFGGSISKSAVLNFIDEQPYVDFVTELKLFHIDEKGNKSADLDKVTVSNPKAILVSTTEHFIKEYTEEDACK